jgi:MFS family permease
VILIGAPTWAVVGLFITFTPEFAKAFGMTDIPKAGTAVLFCYTGLLIGDMFSGLLSQKLRSRKKAVGVFLAMSGVFSFVYILFPYSTTTSYYAVCLLLGIGVGYWAMFVQMGAEQFGTNIRATAATSIPNMVRGLTVPMTLGFHALIPTIGIIWAGMSVMLIVLALAVFSLWTLKETFTTDLDYLEH